MAKLIESLNGLESTQIMDIEQIAKEINEKIDLPLDCMLLATASGQSGLGDGSGLFRIRRNMCLDVTGLIPQGTVSKDQAVSCSPDELIYLDIQENMREHFADEILKILKIDQRPRCYGLSSNRDEDTEVFFLFSGVLIVRSNLLDQENQRTSWQIDLMLVLEDPRMCVRNALL